MGTLLRPFRTFAVSGSLVGPGVGLAIGAPVATVVESSGDASPEMSSTTSRARTIGRLTMSAGR